MSTRASSRDWKNSSYNEKRKKEQLQQGELDRMTVSHHQRTDTLKIKDSEVRKCISPFCLKSS